MFLVAMTVLAVFSLLLGVVNQVDQQSLSNQRNRDRVASELEACARSNNLRRQVISVGAATDSTVRQTLDIIFSTVLPGATPAVSALREHLDAPLAQIRAAIAAIRLVDCRAVTTGAQETP